jgi:hypothetical protein
VRFVKSIAKNCKNVQEKLNEFVIICGYSGGKYQYSNGVSLFFPWSYETLESVRNNYEELWFYKNINPELKERSWASFLELYLGKVARRGSEEPRKPKHRYPWVAFEEEEFSKEKTLAAANIIGKLGTGQGRLGTGQGRLGTGQGRLGTGQGRLGTGQGRLGTGQGRLGTGQGRLSSDGSNAFLDSLQSFKNVYTPWNISGFSKETDK